MDVQAGRAHMLERGREAQRLDRGGRRQAELRPGVAGRDLAVRIRLDAGRDPHEHRSGVRPAAAASASIWASSADVVDHHQAGPRGDRRGHVRVGLVVAVHDQPVAGHPRGQCEGELTLRGDVHPQPLLDEHPQHGHRHLRLAGERRPGGAGVRPQAVAIGPGPRPQRDLVVDVERRAVAGGEVAERHAADGQAAVGDRRRFGEDAHATTMVDPRPPGPRPHRRRYPARPCRTVCSSSAGTAPTGRCSTRCCGPATCRTWRRSPGAAAAASPGRCCRRTHGRRGRRS